MKPIGPLMTEHRLIERMINVLSRLAYSINQEKKVDIGQLRATIDFLRTYAGRTHHGKEEGILFRELAKKRLSANDSNVLNELIAEHATARRMVARLDDAKELYLHGRPEALRDIARSAEEIASFYPLHIAKEDKHFFFPCLEYLSRQEQDDMLREFWEFDRRLIHEKYQKVVEETEGKRDAPPGLPPAAGHTTGE